MVAGIMRSAGRPLSSAAGTGSNDRPTRRHEPRAVVGDRLDLDDTALMAAKEPEVGIVASTDAHSVEGLEHMEHGVYQVRRAGLEAQDVADTRTVAQFRMLLKR